MVGMKNIIVWNSATTSCSKQLSMQAMAMSVRPENFCTRYNKKWAYNDVVPNSLAYRSSILLFGCSSSGSILCKSVAFISCKILSGTSLLRCCRLLFSSLLSTWYFCSLLISTLILPICKISLCLKLLLKQGES